MNKKLNKFIITVRQISKRLSRDSITNYAAQSCFYMILSAIPFLVLLMSLIHYLPVTPDAIIEFLKAVIPPKIEPMLESIINDVYNNSSVAIISMTTIVILWSAGKGFISIIQCLNTIYDAHRHRNWFVSRLMSTFYTIIFLVSIVASLILLVFGNKLVSFIGPFLPGIARILEAVLNNKTLLFPGALMLIFMFMYKYLPNRKSTLLNELPGAAFSSVGWFLFSYIYSLYVNSSPNFSLMYGSLSTLIFALIWIYCCLIILFLGAEINMFISKKRSGDYGSWIEEL